MCYILSKPSLIISLTLTMIAAEGPPSCSPLHEASELLIGHRVRSVAGGKVLEKYSPSAGDAAPLYHCCICLISLHPARKRRSGGLWIMQGEMLIPYNQLFVSGVLLIDYVFFQNLVRWNLRQHPNWDETSWVTDLGRSTWATVLLSTQIMLTGDSIQNWLQYSLRNCGAPKVTFAEKIRNLCMQKLYISTKGKH